MAEHNFKKKSITSKQKKSSEKNIKKKEDNLKKKINKKRIEDDLFEIYGDNKNKKIDMSKINRNKNKSFFKSFFIFLVSLAFFLSIAWVGFFMLEPQDGFSEDGIDFEITGSENIKIGEEFSYRVSYKNSQNIDLHDVNLELRYPKGFIFINSSLPSNNEENNIWNLGDIKAFDSGYIDIEGKIFNNLNAEQSIRAFLNYIPENFSSEFQKVTHISISSNESPISVDFKIPENISKNSDVEFNLTLAPEDLEVKNLKVLCEADGFNFKSSNLESVDNLCEWQIEELKNEEEINFTGDFSEAEDSEIAFTIKIFKLDDETKEEYIIFEKEEKIILSKTDFVFNLAINGVMSESIIKPGEVLNSSIVIKNSGETALEDVVVNMTFDAPSYNNFSLLKWIALDVEPYDADVYGEQLSTDIRRGIITWTKDYVEGLEKIMPGEEVHIDFSLPIKDNDDLNLFNFEEYKISASAEIEYKKNDQKEIKQSNKIEFISNSDLELDVMNSEKSKNNYKITWLLSNSFHDLKNVVLEADIYGKTKVDVEKIIHSSGEVEYNEKENKIIWKIDELPTNIPDVIINSFEVELLEENPTQEDLISKVSVTAEDEKTGEIIKFFGEEVKL